MNNSPIPSTDDVKVAMIAAALEIAGVAAYKQGSSRDALKKNSQEFLEAFLTTYKAIREEVEKG